MEHTNTGESFPPMDLGAVKFIKGSTHVALSMIVIDFDFETLTYTFQTSETVLLGHEAVDAFSLVPETVVAPQHTGFVALGLQYCEVFGEEVYPMKGISGLGCKIVETIRFVRLVRLVICVRFLDSLDLFCGSEFYKLDLIM